MHTTLKIVTSALVFALAVTAHAAAQASSISAKLVIPETQLLPGVPFEAWLELENRSEATLAVGLYASLRASSADGTFTFHPQHPDLLLLDRTTHRAVYYLELASGARETLTLPIENLLTAPAVFSDRRISEPGRYTIALQLDAWPPMKLLPSPPRHFAGPVVTNDVTIERIAPVGPDAAVWPRLREFAENGTIQWVPGLWPEYSNALDALLTRYPDSGYVPYALLAGTFGNAREKYLKLTLDAIRRFPSTPVIDQLRFTAATVAGQLVVPDIAEAQRVFLLDSRKPTTRALVYGPLDPRRRVPDSR